MKKLLRRDMTVVDVGARILQFLTDMDYQWFAIAAKGALLPIPCNLETYDPKPGRASDRAHSRISKPAWAKVRGNLQDSLKRIGKEELSAAALIGLFVTLRKPWTAAILACGK